MGVIWKTISYAAQYISEGENQISACDVTITILRASKPVKVLKELKNAGYIVANDYLGIYYVDGMVDLGMQIVVSSELRGDDYIPLRMQKKNADSTDIRKFADNIKSTYTKDEEGFVEAIVKFGIYDNYEIERIIMEDEDMYKRFMELFKDEFEKREEQAREEGKAEGQKE